MSYVKYNPVLSGGGEWFELLHFPLDNENEASPSRSSIVRTFVKHGRWQKQAFK